MFRGVDLRGADLTGANLTRAEIHDSDLRGADLRRAVLVGPMLRACDLGEVHWEGSTAHRAQALWCQPPQQPPRPWLADRAPARPAPITGPTTLDLPAPAARLAPFTGHTSGVWGGAFSPDGTRILTTGSDETARVWDAATGQVLLTLTGHTGRVRAVAFSPDGARIVTTGGTTRRRGCGTRHRARPCSTLTGHTGAVSGGGVQPGRHADRHRQRRRDGAGVGRGHRARRCSS